LSWTRHNGGDYILGEFELPSKPSASPARIGINVLQFPNISKDYAIKAHSDMEPPASSTC